MVHRRQDDARTDLDPRRRLGERRAHHEQRGHVPVIDEVVLRRPDRREAEPLSLDGQADRLVIGARPIGLPGAELRAQESKAESHDDSVHTWGRRSRSQDRAGPGRVPVAPGVAGRLLQRGLQREGTWHGECSQSSEAGPDTGQPYSTQQWTADLEQISPPE